MTTNVQVRIGTEWTGRGALQQASKDVGVFEAGLHRLQTRLASTFAIYKVAQFGKASLNAFTQDNLAAQQLTHTLDQLGLAFDSKQVAAFIQQTEKLTGVLDDQLRPAMMLFLRTTGSVTRSEELLNTALNISKATGKDLTSVSSALSRAYYGNYTALQRLGIGINTATLKGKDWQVVQDQLNATFAGAATVAANSYQGSIDKLKVAVDNAKESIGKGMVDAIKALSSSGTLDAAVSGIEKLGSVIGNAAGAIGRFIAASKLLLTQGSLTQEQKWQIFGKPVTEIGTRGAGRAAVDNAAARAAAESKVTAQQLAQQKASAALAKSKKEALIISQAEALLNKSKNTFDIQQAEIYAALQNDKITADEKLRLQMLATQDQLAAAIADKNIPLVEALTGKLQNQTNQFAIMQKIDPYSGMTIGADALTQSILKAIEAQKQLNDLLGSTSTSPSLPPASAVPSPDKLTPANPFHYGDDVSRGGQQFTNITIELDGQVLANATAGQSANGVNPRYIKNNYQETLMW